MIKINIARDQITVKNTEFPMSDLIIESQATSTNVRMKIGSNCRLTLADAKQLATHATVVELNTDSHEKMATSYLFLKNYLDQRLPIYGINTHFGDQVGLLDANLKDADATRYYESINARQENLIRSHSCGLGDVVAPEIVRVAMMLRAHCLSQGYSGVTPETVQTILAYLNSGITPIVRCYGSIGASGDLIPLAMIAAGIIGEDVDVLYQGKILKAPLALEMAGLKKFKPQQRDGLAMINGTSFMTAIASIALYDLRRLFKQMLSAVGMCLESMMVISSGYDPLVHHLKGQHGEIIVNNFLLDFWQGSHLLTDLDELRHANLDDTSSRPVQDYYSVRSVSQGFGPFQENIECATHWIENEMNSVNDNPIIDAENNKIHHNANFMGYYVTDSGDLLKMNIAQASTWLHALLANLIHPRKNHQLPANLVEEPGKQNGFRPLQLLTAAIAVQNRKLAQCHQSITLPTEGDNQDVNSLGTHVAFDFRESVANLERLTAIMLLAATQALELRGIEKAGEKSRRIFQIIRKHSPKIANCRPMSDEINSIVQLLKKEKI